MARKWHRVEGALLLRRAVDSGKLPGTLRAFAAQIGTTQNVLWAWRSGFRRPGPAYREILERLLGIPRSSWLTSTERRLLERVAA